MKKLLFLNELVWQNLARYDWLFTAFRALVYSSGATLGRS